MRFIPLAYMNFNKNKETKGKDDLSILKISYLGTYYSNIRNIIPLYNAARELPKLIELVIAGCTDIKLESTKNIKVLPNMTKEKVSKFEDESDIIVCILNKSGTQIPGKLYYYAGTSKPILVITDGEYGSEIKAYLNGFNRYLFCENNEKEIKETLLNIDKLKEYEPVECLSPSNITSILIEPQKEFNRNI